MNSSLKDLYQLQQIDSRIAYLNKRYHELDNGSALKALYDETLKQNETFQTSFKNLQRDIKDAELELANIEAKEKECHKSLYGGRVSNPKELAALEKEIESLKKQRSRLDEKILLMMDEAEANKNKEKELTAHLMEVEQNYKNKESEYKKEVSILAIEARNLKAEREKLAPTINSAMLKKYESLRSGKAGIGIGKIETESCSACHTTLRNSVIRRIKDSEEIVFCDNCGRMLYIPE